MIYFLQEPPGAADRNDEILITTQDYLGKLITYGHEDSVAKDIVKLIEEGLSPTESGHEEFRRCAGWEVIGQVDGDDVEMRRIWKVFDDHRCPDRPGLFRPAKALLDFIAQHTARWDGEDAKQLVLNRPKPRQDRPAPVAASLAGRLRRQGDSPISAMTARALPRSRSA